MFRILVVDDDREINRTVYAFLNQNGYEATGCLSADEAYDAMYENVFDLIVSDIMMPDIDGFEFAKEVRSINTEIPILFITARDDFASSTLSPSFVKNSSTNLSSIFVYPETTAFSIFLYPETTVFSIFSFAFKSFDFAIIILLPS